ncbi:ead/Ea22-like family protein [Pseudomonas asiatica]|jgi:regulator of replication initiation timing|uniref:ead/Ea22-like family protein n=1 Tax=Pseudomonas asiatica TaxID=2219225 RepID=UPI001E54CA44|nr:ead/Ea22-like family protein [Pseudomonas asiatica]MCE0853958.1 ead/Ea22-like family protein [Pseudomonas asiatica]
MTIDKQKLKALAEAATQSHGARRVEVDHNGVHVIGDGSWKILSAWHTPDGKGAQNAEFAAAASPTTILALLAEVERLESAKGDPIGSFDKHMEYMQENIRLKVENESLRKALGKISVQVDENIRCAVRDVVNGLPDVQDIYGYCDNIDEIIDAALAKEASR